MVMMMMMILRIVEVASGHGGRLARLACYSDLIGDVLDDLGGGIISQNWGSISAWIDLQSCDSGTMMQLIICIDLLQILRSLIIIIIVVIIIAMIIIAIAMPTTDLLP
jgi:hypothetical protein